MLLAFFHFQKFELLSNRVKQASCKSELCGSWGWSVDQGCTEVKFTGRDKRLDYLIAAAGLFSKFILRRTHWDGEKFNEPFASDAACGPSREFGSSSTGFWIHVYRPLARLSCNFLSLLWHLNFSADVLLLTLKTEYFEVNKSNYERHQRRGQNWILEL